MTHGTISGYNKHGCRCDECRAASRAQSKRYYASKVRLNKPSVACKMCGIEFRRTRTNMVYCDEGCRRLWALARGRRPNGGRKTKRPSKPVNPARNSSRDRTMRKRVGQRDGWMCWHCKRPIDLALRYPHPGSASLEHMTPLALGGTTTEANCTVSHHRCNVAAGGRLGNIQRRWSNPAW